MSEILNHLQNEKVRHSLSLSAQIKEIVRKILFKNGFQEFDTPVLSPRTGEKYNTTFDIQLEDNEAMLVDSPQLYKMILMLSGYEKYFQFAHCFRVITNEDNLHTRLSEFVQMDIELKNTDLDELVDLAKQMLIEICKLINRVPKISYMSGLSCRADYGEEMKPDLRENEDDISIVFVKHMPLTNGKRIPCHHIFAKPSKKVLEEDCEALLNFTTESFDIVVNGVEVGGGDLRIMNSDEQRNLMKIFDVDESRYKEYLSILDLCEGNQGGGFAIGLERLIMVLLECDNISQTVAFPNFYKRGVL